jgi:hypothetical protein
MLGSYLPSAILQRMINVFRYFYPLCFGIKLTHSLYSAKLSGVRVAVHFPEQFSILLSEKKRVPRSLP